MPQLNKWQFLHKAAIFFFSALSLGCIVHKTNYSGKRIDVSDDSLHWWIPLTWDGKRCASNMLQKQEDDQVLLHQGEGQNPINTHMSTVIREKICRDWLYSPIFVLQVTMPAGWIMEAVLPSAWLSQGAECVLALTTSTWTGTMSPAQVSHFKPPRT